VAYPIPYTAYEVATRATFSVQCSLGYTILLVCVIHPLDKPSRFERTPLGELVFFDEPLESPPPADSWLPFIVEEAWPLPVLIGG